MAGLFRAYVRWVKREPGAALVLVFFLLWVLMVGSFLRVKAGPPGDKEKAAAFENEILRAEHAQNLTAPAGAQ